MLTRFICQNLLVLTGPSGSGKSAITHKMAETYLDVDFAVTHTSRQPRAGEVHGKDYYFVTSDEFEDLKSSGGFAECVTYGTDSYGLSFGEVTRATMGGGQAVVVMTAAGLATLRERWPSLWGVLINPGGGLDVLEARMRQRNDSEANIAKRLASVSQERKDAEGVGYDFEIFNRQGALIEACQEVRQILKVMKKRLISNSPRSHKRFK